jgi:hypothetical protein
MQAYYSTFSDSSGNSRFIVGLIETKSRHGIRSAGGDDSTIGSLIKRKTSHNWQLVNCRASPEAVGELATTTRIAVQQQKSDAELAGMQPNAFDETRSVPRVAHSHRPDSSSMSGRSSASFSDNPVYLGKQYKGERVIILRRHRVSNDHEAGHSWISVGLNLQQTSRTPPPPNRDNSPVGVCRNAFPAPLYKACFSRLTVGFIW